MSNKPTLEVLADKRDLILRAEIGALVHDLGKLSAEFVSVQAELSKQLDFEHHLVLRRAMRGYYSLDPAASMEVETSFKLEVQNWVKSVPDEGVSREERVEAKRRIWERLKKAWLKISDKEGRRVVREEALVPDDFLPDSLLQLLDDFTLTFRWPVEEKRTMGDFIEAHHSPMLVTHGAATQLLTAGFDGSDGVDSAVDKAGAEEGGLKQSLDDTRIATAFGHEPDGLRIKTDELKRVRHDYANGLASTLQFIQKQKSEPNQNLDPLIWEILLYGERIVKKENDEETTKQFEKMVNEFWVSFHAESRDEKPIGLRRATKIAFCKALGETRRAANDVTLWDHSFSVASLYKAALAKIFLERARNPTYTFPEVKDIHWRLLRVSYDGLGYLQQAHHVTDMLGRQSALQKALDQVKQALEVCFPLGNEIYRDENGSAFLMPDLDGDDDDGNQIKDLVQAVIQQAFSEHLWGEVTPQITSSRRTRQAVELGSLLAQPSLLAAKPDIIQQAWQGRVGAEVCPICELRPQGYVTPDLPDFARDADKAKERHLCGVCLARRGRRSQDWTRNDRELTRTIWLDEVTDEHGRVALLVGRFGLEDWLTGKHIDSLLAAPGCSKYPSFARLRRTWETTQRFWQEAETQILDQVLRVEERRLELTLEPPNLPGKFHVYEARYSFGDVPVVWNSDRLRLITATNLKALGRPSENSQVWDRKLRGPVTLYEPSGYGRASVKAGDFRIIGAEQNPTTYKPYISLLTEPFVFMALLPCAKALEAVGEIRDRYEEEMGRVRDRLPLHLGLVFFDRHTPLYAALDAGRRMLASPSEQQVWMVKEVDSGDQRYIVFQNDVEWYVPLKMGDGKTPDQWYLGALGSVSFGEQVQVHPSRFEYLFLDASARRFDVRLDEETCRRPHPLFGRRHSPRPYLLEDLDRMEQVWQWCWPNGMTTIRLHGIRDLLAARFEEWNLAQKERTSQEWDTYRGLVKQVLGKEFGYRSGEAYETLEKAMLDGLFFDCLELHLQILKEKGVER